MLRYIDIAVKKHDRQLYSTHYILGKAYTALSETKKSCDAFEFALTGPLSKEEYVQTITGLINGYIKQKDFVQAIAILENTQFWQFSNKEAIEILLLKSRCLREIGLTDKAIATLGDQVDYITDPQLKARLAFELAKCHITKGKLELARDNLAKILIIVEPGPLAQKIMYQLADDAMQRTAELDLEHTLLTSRLQQRQSELLKLSPMHASIEEYQTFLDMYSIFIDDLELFNLTA